MCVCECSVMLRAHQLNERQRMITNDRWRSLIRLDRTNEPIRWPSLGRCVRSIKVTVSVTLVTLWLHLCHNHKSVKSEVRSFSQQKKKKTNIYIRRKKTVTMNQYLTERRLTWLYGLLALFLTVSVVCLAIPFNHWQATLDRCPSIGLENNNCGCILFGVSTSQYFTGSHTSSCFYAIFAPLPIIVYAIVMALFHMYRVCINNVGKYEDEKSTTVEEIEGESIVATSRARISHHNDAVIYCWIPTSCIAAIFCVYNLVHAGYITAGFMRTCTQYRGYLARELRSVGNHVSVIHFRLTCQAIFDFMDYLQKDAMSRRSDYINTGVALQLALVASWLSVGLWLLVSIYTARRAYKERDVLTCCGS